MLLQGNSPGRPKGEKPPWKSVRTNDLVSRFLGKLNIPTKPLLQSCPLAHYFSAVLATGSWFVTRCQCEIFCIQNAELNTNGFRCNVQVPALQSCCLFLCVSLCLLVLFYKHRIIVELGRFSSFNCYIDAALVQSFAGMPCKHIQTVKMATCKKRGRNKKTVVSNK